MTWLLIGYMWLEIHRPYEIWTWLAAYHVERIYVIFTIVYWLLAGARLPPRNRLHAGFAVLVAAMLASWWTSPYADIGQGAVEGYLKYAVFYYLVVTTVRSERDLGRILVGYLGATTLWMVHSLREFYCGNQTWQQGFIRLAPVGKTYDFNDMAGLIVCSLPLAWVAWRQWPQRWNRLMVAGYCVLACCCIVKTGSRMGFVGMIVACLLACWASPKRWRLLVLFSVAFTVFWFFLPASHQERYSSLLGDDYNGKFARAGEYRYEGFRAALPMFAEQPLLGNGPLSFRAVKGFMPHNLYGQLLAELGIAGTIAFAAILWGVGRNFLEARRIVRETPHGRLAWNTVAAVGAVYLLLVIMSWGFNFLFWHVWLWFGSFQIVALQCLKNPAEMEEIAGEADETAVAVQWN